MISSKLISVLFAAALLTAQDQKPSPVGPAQQPVTVSTSNELFASERAEADRQHATWVEQDDLADAPLSGSVGDSSVYQQKRDQIAVARRQKKTELDAWTVYYQKVAAHWQSVHQAIVSGTANRTTARQDIVNIAAVEKKELEEALRRRADLTRSLNDKGVDVTRQPAITELSKVIDMKRQNVETAERALRETDIAFRYEDKRRDLARTRTFQASQLVRSVEVERPLWEAVYSGRLHKLDLEREEADPGPAERKRWQDNLKTGGND